VSNRLPITIKRSDDGKYDFSMSSGGLVSGLSVVVSICQVIVNEDRYSAVFFLEALLHDGDLGLGNGKYDFSMSSGGLVSGLSGLSKSTTFQWYGWPGLAFLGSMEGMMDRMPGENGG
jgi:trehalose-6-phosphate synthase